jgi:hypothetical protein
MGADLYIMKLHKKLEKEWGPWVDKAVTIRNMISVIKNSGRGFTYNNGAPIDFNKVFDEAHSLVEFLDNKQYEEGYFRDPYNDSTMLNVLGGSYWRDVSKMCDKKGDMKLRQIKTFINWLEAHKVPEVEWFNTEWIKDTEGKPNEGKIKWIEEEGADKIQAYFVSRREEMLALFNKALELKQPVHCSV